MWKSFARISGISPNKQEIRTNMGCTKRIVKLAACFMFMCIAFNIFSKSNTAKSAATKLLRRVVCPALGLDLNGKECDVVIDHIKKITSRMSKRGGSIWKFAKSFKAKAELIKAEHKNIMAERAAVGKDPNELKAWKKAISRVIVKEDKSNSKKKVDNNKGEHQINESANEAGNHNKYKHVPAKNDEYDDSNSDSLDYVSDEDF
eukprot:417150_1